MIKAAIPPDHFKNHHLLLKENEADARARLRAFWANSSLGRPAVLASVIVELGSAQSHEASAGKLVVSLSSDGNKLIIELGSAASRASILGCTELSSTWRSTPNGTRSDSA